MSAWIESLSRLAALAPEPPKTISSSNMYATPPELVRVLAGMVLSHSYQEVSG